MGTFNIGNTPVAPIITYGGTDDILHETVNGVYKVKKYLTEFVIPDEITELGDYVFLYGLQIDSSSLTKINFNNVKICGNYSMNNFTSGGNFENLSTLEFPNLQKCGDRCFNNAFARKGSLVEVNFPELISIGSYCFYNCFNYDPIIKISFPKLESAPADCFMGTFANCKQLIEVDFLVLNSIYQSAFSGAFSACTSLESISFPALNKITSSSCFYNAFRSCTSLKSISFPALDTSSFGSVKNQFNSMLAGVTGCTVHFPASIESTISSWASVQSGFSGTDTVVLFDL